MTTRSTTRAVKPIQTASRQIERLEKVLARERRVRAQLERDIRARERFLTVLSHDLRVPLNAVLGWTQMLRTGRLRPANRDRALAAIERSAHMQIAIVEEVLDVARLQAGKLLLERAALDLRTVVTEVVDAIAPAAATKRITVGVQIRSDDSTVLADARRMRQIVTNLVSNAVKYTPAGGRIDVALTSDERCVRICVQDTGIGVEPDALARIFDCFEQGSAAASSGGGLGLGLFIVRRLVELHGGSARAWSDGRGEGTTFDVSIPRARGARHRASSA